MTKMTYVTALEAVLNGEAMTEEIRAKLTALRDSVAKKNATKNGKPTKEQKENVAVKHKILAILPTEGGMKCGEVAVAVGITQNRASALLTQMVASGFVHREMVKRSPMFTKLAEMPAEVDEDETEAE